MLRSSPYNLIVVVLLTLLSADLPGFAQEQPAAPDPEQLKAEGQQQLEREISAIPSIGAREMRDVLAFSIDRGDLAVSTNLEQTQGESRVQIKDLPGFSKVMVQRAAGGDGGAAGGSGDVRMLQFTHFSFTTPGTLKVQTQVFTTIGYGLQVSRTIERLGEDLTVQYIQMRPPGIGIEQLVEEQSVTLYVQGMNSITEQATVDLKLSAPNIVELRWLYPKEAATYLQPIFDDLGQATVFAVDPRLAWLVFADAYKPDDATKAKVDALVSKLDADTFSQRDDALTSLQKLGQDAALYLMNVDRSSFSAEQNTLIDTFLAEYRPLSEQRAQALRTNVGFLLDCLYSENEAIRARALSTLEEVTARDLPFDPAAAPETRVAAVRQVRDTLLGTPSTQPTTDVSGSNSEKSQ